MPRVSIILPTHNRAAMLREAIHSVLAQTFTNWELIIIDDGSTDETPAVAQAYAEACANIRYIRQPNMGLGKTRERSISLCRGEFIALLDDDDLFRPEKLERQAAFLREHPDVAMVYSSTEVIASDGTVLERQPRQPALTFLEMIDDCPVYVTSVLIRKSCFDEVGTFRGDLPMSADHEMYLRICRHKRFAFLPGVVGCYRRHEGNMTGNYFKIYEETLGIYNELLREPLSTEIRLRVLFARRRMMGERAALHYRVAAQHLADRAYGAAAAHFAQAIRFDGRIGARIPWGASKPIAYRLLRPYGAAAYSAGMAAGAALMGRRPSHAAR